jgi:uncharacterized repeat protein (TIGR01451 family)
MRRIVVGCLFLCLISVSAFAQSADQELTVTAAPDPVVPGNNLTYSVTVTNHGPNAAVNGGMNGSLANQVIVQSMSGPAGFTCSQFGQAISCITPSFASGATAAFTIVVQVDPGLLPQSDGSFTSIFAPSGTTADPVPGNNVKNVTTNFVTPDADVSVTASDAPDPVTPNNNITYTILATNGGPDPATNTNMSVVYNGGSTRFVSMSTPAGWSCATPAVGAQVNFSCSNPSFAVGSATFTLVLSASVANIGVNDTTIPQNFTINSATHDTNNNNNVAAVQTTYDAPSVDMAITASDSPDPVAPNGNITYTVQVTNNGPDAAQNAAMSTFGSGVLRFQSVTAPAGWTCSAPAVGASANFDCHAVTLASGTVSNFTVVLKADYNTIGPNPTTLTQGFSTSNDWSDPNNNNNVMYVTTAYQPVVSDLAVTGSGTPPTVAVGNNITYTGTISNAGPDAAASTVLTIPLDAKTFFQSISGPAGFSCTTPAVGASGMIQCTNASFASGGSGSYTLVVQVNPALTIAGSVSQSISISSNNSDPQLANNSVTIITPYTVPPSADLSVTKSTGSSSVAPGGSLTYTIVVTNAGPSAATTVVMTDTLPATLLFQSISAPAGFSCTTPSVGSTGTISCTAATLANGATATFTLVTQVAGNATGTISNSAAASSATNDPNGGNSSGSAGAVTVGSGPSADLGITKTTGSTGAAPGGTIVYTLTASNHGPDAASSVVVTDTLPASLLFQSITSPAGFTCTTPAVGASGTITCSGATLANGNVATFTLTTKVAPGATGSISNSAGISSATSDPVGGNGGSSATAVPVVAASADLSISKSTAAQSAPNGSTISYLLTVTNAGPSPATSVVVSDDLPTGLQLVSATPSQGSCTQTDPVSCTLGTLASGASATITIQALVTATSGSISNTATVSAAESDPNGSNNSATTSPLAVPPGGGGPVTIPTMSEWALAAVAMLLAAVALSKPR